MKGSTVQKGVKDEGVRNENESVEEDGRPWRTERESSGFNFSSYPLPIFLQNKNHQNNMN